MTFTELSHFFAYPEPVSHNKECIGTRDSASIDRPLLVTAVKLPLCYSAGAASLSIEVSVCGKE